ncbi:hypothetical protein CAC01_26685 [Streptomyces sp. CLI2509]|nr:hypothetical protein CAC01_26685 [Streptomyces sp. CLI2509]
MVSFVMAGSFAVRAPEHGPRETTHASRTRGTTGDRVPVAGGMRGVRQAAATGERGARAVAVVHRPVTFMRSRITRGRAEWRVVFGGVRSGARSRPVVRRAGAGRGAGRAAPSPSSPRLPRLPAPPSRGPRSLVPAGRPVRLTRASPTPPVPRSAGVPTGPGSRWRGRRS